MGLRGKLRAVPAARRLARELAVDLQLVRGTGPEGRIQSEDVRSYSEAAVQPRSDGTPQMVARQPAEPVSVQPRSDGTPPEPPVPTVALAGAPAIRRMVPLTNIRRTIAERMTASVREAPQFTVSVEADMTRALAIVEDLRPRSDGTPREAARRAGCTAPGA